MDSYSASLSNRRYPSGGSGLLGSSPSTSKLRLNQGSTLSNLSNNKKPRASSASVTRKNNSRFEAASTLPLGGSGSFLPSQQGQFLRANGNSLNGNEGGARNGNFISSNPALSNSTGGAFAGDSRGDSYDQIRRNYEQNRLVGTHKSGYGTSEQNNSSLVLSSSNGYNNGNNNSYGGPPRAQSASGMSRAANSYNNAFNNGNSATNSAAAQSNAYLAMRQSTAGTASPPPELMNGNANNTSFGSGAFGANGAPANSNNIAKNKFGIPLTTNTRGIANGGLSNNSINSGAYLNSTYGNTTVGSLMALSSNPTSPRNKYSTEIIPANFMPAPILCAKSSYSATSKGVNRVSSHNKRVSFSTPLTNSTPLQNPFMCQNIPAWNAANGISNTTNATNNSANNSGRFANNSGAGGAYSTGGNSALFRPASASAAMMSTATTHFLNNTLNANTNNNNAKNITTTNPATTNNVIINGGVVLTGATVVASVSNSRSESPVTGPLTLSTQPINLASAFNNLNAGSTPSHALNNAPNMSKPPLFFSSIGGQQYENNAKSTIEGVASPKYVNQNAPRGYGTSSPSTLTQPVSNLQSNSGETSPMNESALPSIRVQQAPSPRPGSANNSTNLNNTQHNNNNSHSATNTTTTTNNSNTNNSTQHNLVPLFTPSPNSSTKKGLVLSNSMENFASYGMTNDGIGTTQGSLSKYNTHMSASNLQSRSNSDNNSVNSSTSISSGTFKPSVTATTTANNIPVVAGLKRNNSTSTTANIINQSNTINTTNTSANNANTPLHLRRNGSAGSLAELNFLRITPPVMESTYSSKLSPKSAAIVNSIRDDSVLLQANSGVVSTAGGNANAKGKKRHSITDQLAHIGANMNNNSVNSNSTTAASTPTLTNHTADTPGQSLSGKGENSSFFTQSLNSAIAIGRSVVSNVQSLSPTLTSGKHYTNTNTNNTANASTLSIHGTLNSSSNSLQSLTTKGNDYSINVPTNHAYSVSSPVNSPDFDIETEESITGVGNSLVIVPCKSFSIGTFVCRSPTKMSFYAEHCEYPFNHPYENSTVYLSIPYRDMTAITTVGMKFRFKIPRKCSMVLGEFDTQNALHLVTLELSHTSSMSVVRERVVPLVSAK